MSTLAHVFEAAGLATVTLASMRPVVEAMAVPRALFCNFPLGRPLGRPNDAAFQRDVLDRAFAMLTEPTGPVLIDHPDTLVADETAMSCQMPPRFDPNLPAAVDEANGIRKAYDRAVQRMGATSVGRSVDADGVPGALAVLQQIADGAHWKDVDIPGKNTIALCHDIRTYYEEAATELTDGPPPGGRQAETWYFDQTEAGKTVLSARKAMQAAEAPFPFWFYMAPGHR